MNEKITYQSQVEIKNSGEHTIKTNFTYWASNPTGELIEAEITQVLLEGKSITLVNNEIYVTVAKNFGEPKLSHLLEIANDVLQNDFKMECDDNFGIHRSVIAKSIRIYPGGLNINLETFFEIQFDMIIKLSNFDMEEIVTEIKNNGFFMLQPLLCNNFFKALKLAHDRPSDYMISKIQEKYWIRPRTYEIKKLWKYYAPLIWGSVNQDDDVIRLIQIICPDRELRKRLNKISLPNYCILKAYRSDLEEYTAKLEATQKILELKDDKTDIKKKVGLYIIQQIRENPEKYLNSNLPFIKEIAEDIIHTAQT